MFAAHSCYLDSSNGAAISSRTLMEALARRGFDVEVVCGAMLDLSEAVDPAAWLARQGFSVREEGGDAVMVDASGAWSDDPPHFLLSVDGVSITMHRSNATSLHEPDDAEAREFLALFGRVVARFRPDVIVGYGGNRLAGSIFARARSLGIVTVFHLHNLNYDSIESFADVDATIVPSRFAAEHYRQTIGLECAVLPNVVDPKRVRADDRDPKYVTFVNPSPEKGVAVFARVADELGRRRPDIPLLVVEARGTEATLAACGLDLRAYGNVSLMAQTHDPRRFWRISRICLMPSLCPESFGRVVAEAMFNGVPVVASNRGALPEILGEAGIVLPLPDRLPSLGLEPPTAEEAAPWVEAIIRLWDDADFFENHRQRISVEARRWSPDALEPRCARFFESLGAPTARVARAQHGGAAL